MPPFLLTSYLGQGLLIPLCAVLIVGSVIAIGVGTGFLRGLAIGILCGLGFDLVLFGGLSLAQ